MTTTFWDLMRDCIPGDATTQVGDTHYLDLALRGADGTRQLLEIGSGSGGPDAARTRIPALGTDLAWETVDPWTTARLPQPGDSVPLVAAHGVFERVAHPGDLACEIARVLRPGGRLVGSGSQLEPFNALALRHFTLVGFRALLEEAGLHLVEVRPGIDAVALTLYWVHGRSEQHARYLEERSPLNAEFEEWGRSTGRRPALVNNRALQFCGRFAFVAEKRESGAPQPTEWRRRLDAALAAPRLDEPPAPRPPRRTPVEHPPRVFSLRLPRVPGQPAGRFPGWLRRDAKRDDSRGALRITAEWDRYIARELEQVGLAGYEPETLACFLAATRFAPDGWVYDVGANVGVYALLAAALSSRPVVAFEPTPGLAATARRIGTENDLRFELEELALGRQPGEATFYLSDRSDASNSLAAGYRASSNTLRVTVDTLDGYVERTGRVPGLMKIDTETTEADVLAGGGTVLSRHRPWLLVEILHKRREGDLMDVMRPHGYSWFHITHALPAPQRTELVGDPDYAYRNWLFTPEPPPAHYWRAVEAWRTALARCTPQ